jgi:cell division protein FtsW
MEHNNAGQEKLSNIFLLNTLLLILFGVIMVFSASYMYAKDQMGNSYFFLTKQLIFVLGGIIISFALSKTKINFWYKYAYVLNGAFIFLVLLTFIPGLGVSMKGSSRWLNLGFMNLQPGEFVKYSLILASIKYFDNFEKYDVNQRIINSSGLLVPLLLFVLQPDFGTFAISAMMISFVCYLSHFPRKYFYGMLASGFIAGAMILVAAPYRVKRLLTFLDPWQDPKNSGFQIIQSFLAFANGSFFGQGIGNSKEKLFYLPEAYNDFIFSVVGEELGFVGVICAITLFISFIFLGFRLSLTTKSRVSCMLIAAVVFCIGFQAFLNMGVVLGVLPTKGLNLPFISYGGSSMIANLSALGILFAALKNKGGESKDSASPVSSIKSRFKK